MNHRAAGLFNVILTLLQVLVVQAVAIPTCDNASGAGCSLPAAQEMFTDLAKQGWAVYFVAPPPANDATVPAVAASVSPTHSVAALMVAKLPISSSGSVSKTHAPAYLASSSSCKRLPHRRQLCVQKEGSLALPLKSASTHSTLVMILGELCNFAAYAFVEAIVVTPMGALSVAVCAILSVISLKERLDLLGWLGCGLCILGATVIALNAPGETTVEQILDFQKLFVSVVFLVYFGVILVASLVIIFVTAPRYGKTNMLSYILVCSMIWDKLREHWFIYVLILVLVVILNMVGSCGNMLSERCAGTGAPSSVLCSITTFSRAADITLVLFRGLSASIPSILTLVLKFLVICIGIVVLQLSKREAEHLRYWDLAGAAKNVREEPPKCPNSHLANQQMEPKDTRELQKAPIDDAGNTLTRVSEVENGFPSRQAELDQRSVNLVELCSGLARIFLNQSFNPF
ncbi:magnesium transporter NIPA-domain-containing protein [Mycena vitilis]|nr:magnesium transporter NIPA-domain-containing protein [Mycena vitilis]